jgi:hypothetical protein
MRKTALPVAFLRKSVPSLLGHNGRDTDNSENKIIIGGKAAFVGKNYTNDDVLKYFFPWPESTSELYRPSDRGLSAKLIPTFMDRECHVVSLTDPYGRILDFLDLSRYFFFQVAPHLYSRG